MPQIRPDNSRREDDRSLLGPIAEPYGRRPIASSSFLHCARSRTYAACDRLLLFALRVHGNTSLSGEEALLLGCCGVVLDYYAGNSMFRPRTRNFTLGNGPGIRRRGRLALEAPGCSHVNRAPRITSYPRRTHDGGA